MSTSKQIRGTIIDAITDGIDEALLKIDELKDEDEEGYGLHYVR